MGEGGVAMLCDVLHRILKGSRCKEASVKKYMGLIVWQSFDL